MPLPGILGGFETLQKQFFHIFGAKEKTGKKIRNLKFQEKSFFFFWKNRFFSEKSAMFLRFFYFRFFLPKIVSNPTENRFFAEAEKNDFFVLVQTIPTLMPCHVGTCRLGEIDGSQHHRYFLINNLLITVVFLEDDNPFNKSVKEVLKRPTLVIRACWSELKSNTNFIPCI